MRFDLDAPSAPMAGGENPLELLDLSGLAPAPVGAPLRLALADIDEDPFQPRTEFDPEGLQELAATIAERGVRQPISVRPHPQQPGRWLLNMGARRLRASALAGKADIPAFVDASCDNYDQVIENEQRENLQPIELALFIQRRMSEGQTQAEIARRLGKSRVYVTYVCALVDAPDWLMAVYRQGRCRGITELYELRRLHERDPAAVTDWLSAREFVSRSDLHALRRVLDASSRSEGGATRARSESPGADPALAGTSTPDAGSGVPHARSTGPAPFASNAPPASLAASTVARTQMELRAQYHDGEVRVWLDPVPAQTDLVFISRMSVGGDGGVRTAVPVGELNSLELVRRL
jgi:ParB family chromosome partitioning protein